MTDFQIGIKRLTDVTRCPLCGCGTVKETRKWAQHCNGHWNESVEFECGQKIRILPEFYVRWTCVRLQAKPSIQSPCAACSGRESRTDRTREAARVV